MLSRDELLLAWQLGREFERALMADRLVQAQQFLGWPIARSWEEQVAARMAEFEEAAARRLRRPDEGQRP